MEHLELTFLDSFDKRVSIGIDKRGENEYRYRLVIDGEHTDGKLTATSIRDALNQFNQAFPAYAII